MQEAATILAPQNRIQGRCALLLSRSSDNVGRSNGSVDPKFTAKHCSTILNKFGLSGDFHFKKLLMNLVSAVCSPRFLKMLSM